MPQLTEEQGIELSDTPEPERHSNTPAWLAEIQRAGLTRFGQVGFPSNKTEEWRFTNVAPIAKLNFVPGECDVAAAQSLLARYSFGAVAGVELVFINGHWSRELSTIGNLPGGVRVMSLGDSPEAALLEPYLGQIADIEANPFTALNTGSFTDGAMVHVSRGTSYERPIHLLFLSTGSDEHTVSHTRVVIVAEENSELTVVESYAGESGAYFTNAVTEVMAGANSRIDHNKLQQESRDAFHMATMQVRLERSARFVSHSTTMGGRLTRNELGVVLAGEYADATLNGLVLLDGNRHCDNHTLLDHAAPNCPSHELYKHVLNQKSTGVFKGKIKVRQIAQKTDSKQTSKTLLLSDDAQMNSMPALEIYADDVKCTHGSTTGPVDEEQVFYLRSRGVSHEAARHLLTYAFAADITRRIKVEPVRARIENFMAAQHGLPLDLHITDLGAHDEAVVNS